MVGTEIPDWINKTSVLIAAIDPLLKWLGPIVGFWVGGRLTERRASQRFYLERNHELLAGAYEEIIRALNDQVRYFDFERMHFGTDEDEIPKSWRAELFEKHVFATRALSKAMQLGALYISANAVRVLMALEQRNQPNPDECPEIDFIDSELRDYKIAFDAMLAIAQAELKRSSATSVFARLSTFFRTLVPARAVNQRFEGKTQ